MITKQIVPQFITSDGQKHESIEAAQSHEIGLMFNNAGLGDIAPVSVANLIVSNKAKIIDILTTKANSKVKARTINGGTKKRAAKTNTAIPGVTPEVQAPADVPLRQTAA